MSAPIKFRYVVATFSPTEHKVLVVHDESPEWYREVASFRNKERAEDYVTIENDMRPGGPMGIEEGDGVCAGREGDDKPATPALPPEPDSALIPGEIVRRLALSPAVIMEVAPLPPGPVLDLTPHPISLVVASPSDETGKSDTPPAEPPPVGMMAALKKAVEAVEAPPASILPPITEKAATVFRVMRYLAREGKPATAGNICRATPYTSVQDALEQLEIKGYAACDRKALPMVWRALVDIEPTILRRNAPVQAAPQASPAPPVVEPSVDADTDGHPEDVVTANDLSAKQKALLRTLCDLPSGTALSKVAIAASVGQNDVSFNIGRLRDMNLIDGKTAPTEAGRALRQQLGPQPETKVSFPVVRGDTNKNNGSGSSKTVENSQPHAYKVVEYLKRKGHRVVLNSWNKLATWNVDGRPVSEEEVLEIVNKHRKDAEIPLLSSLSAMT